MPLPTELQLAIDRETESLDRRKVAQASARITEDYRLGRFHGSLNSSESRAAYLLTRLPATFAANLCVFREMARVVGVKPESLLDLGSGPGTAMWAARSVWSSIRHFSMYENNVEFLQLGRRLAGEIRGMEWVQSDISQAPEFPAHDVVVLSYAIGELRHPEPVIAKAWSAAQKMLVIIEPGTPRNFAVLARSREQLIGLGGHPVAPCPHGLGCPMATAGDWCHFAVRLERSAEHRQLKAGSLGYEDEKFSYLTFSKFPVAVPQARIVRHPLVHGGHIQLDLCTPAGLESPTVTRSQKAFFRAARKAKWGDAWPPDHQLE